MPANFAQFEIDLVNFFKINLILPDELPQWMKELGIIPQDEIISVDNIGAIDRNNKTDVLVTFKNSSPLKISVKLSNADYFGNWYGHKRFLEEFGLEPFTKLSIGITNWANEWIKHSNSNIFVGVSICFGKRSGNTALEFLDYFTSEDMRKIVVGADESSSSSANSLFISKTIPISYNELFENLKPINDDTLKEIGSNFKIACRPINPLTERSNRGKNVYTKFQPYKPLSTQTTIVDKDKLSMLGEFMPLTEANRLNHNNILNELQDVYKIVIPRKR